MRITLVINGFGLGGAEHILSNMANYWAAAGHSIIALTFDNKDAETFYELHPSVIHRPLAISTRKRKGLGKIIGLFHLRKVLKKAIQDSCPDLVLSFMDQANILTIMSAASRSYRLAIAERVYPARSSIMESIPAPFAFLMRAFRNFIYAHADNIFVQTEKSRDYFPFSLRKKISVVPNPLFENEEGPMDLTLEPRTVVGMGRLAPQKRFDLLIDGFTIAHSRLGDWSLAIIGDGILYDDLARQARERGLRDVIDICGSTQTPRQVLSSAEIFVLSSDYEGFPGALCQAMACGCAVIATRCLSGPEELITDGENGLLIEPNNPEELADALERLMRDPDLRSRLGANAAKIREKLAPKTIMEQWEQVLGITPAR